MSLPGKLLFSAIRHHKRIAAIDDNRRYTYGQIAGGAMFIAEQIDQVTDCPRVGLLLPTSGAFPMLLLGTWLAGRVAVPLNYLLSADELRYVIEDAGIETIISAGPMLEFLKDARPHAVPDNVRVLKLEEVDFSGWPPLRWPPRPAGEDVAVILYTSGTSGRPKGVMLTYRNLESNIEAAVEYARFSGADTFLGVLPQFHSFGLTPLTLLPMRVGATAIYSARFVPRKIVRLIRKHQPQIVMAVPSMYGALLSVKKASAEDFASIRFAISGGEPLPQDTFETFRNRFGVTIREGYGLTETAPISNWSTPWASKRHSVGKAIPGVGIIIVDDHDQVLPADVEGEILITGPNIMKGYYKLPEQTQAVFTNINGKRFFRTGDIGRQDDEGFLFITGRKKEMLIIGGENVFPREIEEVLNRHDAIQDSAVIGKNDGMRGEVPIAFVELVDGAAFDAAEMRNWCRESLAQFKVPREIRVIDALPRNPTGKIMRRQINSD